MTYIRRLTDRIFQILKSVETVFKEAEEEEN